MCVHSLATWHARGGRLTGRSLSGKSQFELPTRPAMPEGAPEQQQEEEAEEEAEGGASDSCVAVGVDDSNHVAEDPGKASRVPGARYRRQIMGAVVEETWTGNCWNCKHGKEAEAEEEEGGPGGQAALEVRTVQLTVVHRPCALQSAWSAFKAGNWSGYLVGGLDLLWCMYLLIVHMFHRRFGSPFTEQLCSSGCRSCTHHSGAENIALCGLLVYVM